MNKKVLLINPSLPPSGWLAIEKLPPLGLAYLAAVLEKEGVEVKIFDNYLFGKKNDFVKGLLQEFDADIVGIYCSTATYISCLEIARIIKESNPDKIVVTGGPHSTLFPEQMLNSGFFDAVVLGEGEYIFRDFVKSHSRQDWRNIKGLMFKENGNVVSTGRAEFISNLDDLPMPARHLLPMDKYPTVVEFLDISPVYSLNTSRGCPFSCTFCSVKIIWGRSYRSFSPKRVVDEVQLLVEKYGAKGLYFREDNFTLDSRRVIEICRLIKQRGIKFQWVCESRVEHIKEDVLREMSESGCKAIWFGVESGSEETLQLVDKRITKADALAAFSLCKKYNIKTGASFILGLPREKIGDMYKTLIFADELDGYWTWFNYYLGIPGSSLYDMVVKEGLYDQIDANGIARIKTKDFDYKKAMQIRRQIMLIYYFLRPKRLLRLMLESFRAGTWQDYLIGALKIVKIYKVFL
ncbi:MAG: radical SAM protein [Candidatus Omnitrophica bacterium]|nr:radical SAM protein [Candidatus Omnitrophota bacterium]